jgi:hypothetical protein
MEDRRADPVSITTAQVARSEELRHRQNRYLVSMLIRTACFILAVVVDGWARWFFILGAVFLPYVAVVFANTARRKPVEQAGVLHPEPIGELGPGPVTPDEATKATDDDRDDTPEGRQDR